jgi:polyphosphate kinase
MMFHNRDISWLGFNYRVLQEAADPGVPLLERVKFLSIFSSNMDEFFRVRYPVISFYATLKNKTLNQINPPYDKSLGERVQLIVSQQLETFGNIIHEQLLPALDQNGIRLYYNRDLAPELMSQARELFYSRILAFIRPVFIDDKSSPRFFAENNQLYFFVVLKKEGADVLSHAVVNIPSEKLSRFIKLDSTDDKEHIVFIDDIIRDNLPCIFTGFTVHACYSFKVNRNSELFLDEENVEAGILKEMEKKLEKRNMGHPTRFLYERGMPLSIQYFIANRLGLKKEELYEGGRYHNLSNLSSLPVSRKELEYPSLPPLKPLGLDYCGDIFRQIEAGDVLLHFPYESYNPVLAFFNQAAIDPDVKSIAVTLYRVAAESHIVNALISAANNKKQVQVFVELKARFDEANNIRWSKEMEKAGVKIIYSIPKIKVHSKIALVLKESKDGTRGYGYIGTGNFNETTAKFYTDHALFTSRTEAIAELEYLFNLLAKEKTPTRNAAHKFEHLLVSQYNMVNAFEEEIKHQIKNHKKGQEALIRIKLNNLEYTPLISLLYKAGEAGVKIQLLVRGICCIVPGKEGLSENIEAKRIVDRYLEHSRIFIFGSGAGRKVYIGSADWMTRNLQQRIEVCTPVIEPVLQDELVRYFEIQWNDSTKAVTLDADLNQHKSHSQPDHPKSPQEKIYEYLKNRNEVVKK